MIQRILFSESSPNLGGQELQLLQQMVALRARGVEVKLACRPESGICRAALERGLDVVPISFRNSLHLPSIARIARLLRAWRPDAVISHSGHDANICGLAARLMVHRPLLIRARTYQHGVPHAWTYNWLADLTVVPSREMRDAILQNRRIDSQRIHILYIGLPFADIALQAQQPVPAPIEQWLGAHPGRILAHAAMLRGEKGHLFMLEVLASLLPDFPDLRYVIAGEGAERGAIQERIAALNLGEHVLMAGMVQPVAALLKRAAIVIMPSLIEPLGMAQIEALSLGVPVVASKVGGIPETVTHRETGLLAEPGNVPAWREAVAWALNHYGEMQSMAAAGQADVRQRFSIEANIERFLALIGAAGQRTTT